MRAYVIAHNERQFHDWCRAMGVNPAAARYVDSPAVLDEMSSEDVLVDLCALLPALPARQPRAA